MKVCVKRLFFEGVAHYFLILGKYLETVNSGFQSHRYIILKSEKKFSFMFMKIEISIWNFPWVSRNPRLVPDSTHIVQKKIYFFLKISFYIYHFIWENDSNFKNKDMMTKWILVWSCVRVGKNPVLFLLWPTFGPHLKDTKNLD